MNIFSHRLTQRECVWWELSIGLLCIIWIVATVGVVYSMIITERGRHDNTIKIQSVSGTGHTGRQNDTDIKQCPR